MLGTASLILSTDGFGFAAQPVVRMAGATGDLVEKLKSLRLPSRGESSVKTLARGAGRQYLPTLASVCRICGAKMGCQRNLQAFRL